MAARVRGHWPWDPGTGPGPVPARGPGRGPRPGARDPGPEPGAGAGAMVRGPTRRFGRGLKPATSSHPECRPHAHLPDASLDVSVATPPPIWEKPSWFPSWEMGGASAILGTILGAARTEIESEKKISADPPKSQSS